MIRDERGGGDPKNVQIASCGWDASLAGRTLADLSRQRGMEPTIENAAEATLWIVEQGGGLRERGDDGRPPRPGALRARQIGRSVAT